MQKITEIFKNKKITTSFELFPPKTEKGYENLIATIAKLASLRPDFISCTYGAGGGNREKTLDIVQYIQKTYGILSLAHLTCVLHSKDEIKTILDNIKNRGISNILALRGDPPQDHPDWEPTEINFKYSYELCAYIRQHFGNYFGIGVAGFPEGHPQAPSLQKDREFLKLKLDSGADFVITQLFFDNNYYFDYVKELRDLGVTARIIPGILPVTNYKNLLKFCSGCQTTVPEKIKRIFEPIQDNEEETISAGIKFTVNQCLELLQGGAPGLHFYSLNKIHPVDEIVRQVRQNI